jgi:hypothetical protein
VTRLELERIRVCDRCGRGKADLRGEGQERLSVTLDPERARELTRQQAEDDLRTLTDVVLERLQAGGVVPREVVLDVVDGRLRGLLTLARGDDSDVITCTPGEGIALVVRAGLKLYASEEALAHATSRPSARDKRGPETVH